MNEESKTHVLIVDDDVEAALMLGVGLEADFEDFMVSYAKGGPEALDFIRDHPQLIDVALIDRNLDERMDGITLMQRIFDHDPLLPVLLFTVNELEAEALRAIEQGAYLYLQIPRDKPIGQIGFHCKAAVLERATRWQALFQRITKGLHSLDQDEIYEACTQGLSELGYKNIGFYILLKGWIVGPKDSKDSDEFRAVEQRSYLRREKEFPEGAFDDEVDLSTSPTIQEAIDSGESVVFQEVPTVHDNCAEQIIIPLRSDKGRELVGNEVLGVLWLRKLPYRELNQLERSRLETLGEQVAMALQNAIAFRQLKHRQDASNSILNTNYNLLSSERRKEDSPSILTLDPVLDEFANVIAEALDFQRVAISIIDEKKDAIVVHGLGGKGFTKEQAAEARGAEIERAEFEKLHQPQFKHQSSFFVPEGTYDFESYHGFILRLEPRPAKPWEWHANDLLRTEVKSVQGRVLGFISSEERSNQRRPDTNLFGTLEVFARQVAFAVESLTYQQKLEDVRKIGDEISALQERVELYSAVVKNLKQWMPTDSLFITRYHPKHKIQEVIYSKRYLSEEIKLAQWRSVSLGISGYVVRENVPVLLTNGTRQFIEKHNITPYGPEARSWLGVPMRVNNEVIGTIVVQDYKRFNAYNESHLQMLMILANRVASTLRRIEALEQDLPKNYGTIGEMGTRLMKATITMDNLSLWEARIIKLACEITNANYGLVFRPNYGLRKLVCSEWFLNPKYVKNSEKPDSKKSDQTLLLNPRRKEQTSFPVQAHNLRETLRIPSPDGAKDARYIYLVKNRRMKSHMSVPIVVQATRGRSARVLCVLTLESENLNAFKEGHEDMLNILAAYVAQAYMSAEQQAVNQTQLGWGMYDLSTRIVRHRYANSLVALSTQTALLSTNATSLQNTLTAIFTEANEVQPSVAVRLDQCGSVPLNKLVGTFLKKHEAIYNHTLVKVRGRLLCPPERNLIWGNEAGICQVVKILVDNAFEVVTHSGRTGNIMVTTDYDEVPLLKVFNPGPAMPPEAEEVIQEHDIKQLGSQGLAQAKFLLGLYGATLSLTRNMDGGVELTVAFATPSAASMPLSGQPIDRKQLRKQLDRVSRNIASHAALHFVTNVTEQLPGLNATISGVQVELNRMGGVLHDLKSEVGGRLDEVKILNIDEFLVDFTSRTNRVLRASLPKVEYTGDVQADVKVRANAGGLQHVLSILIENAQQAIEEMRKREPDKVCQDIQISISTECKEHWVEVHVHNHGSKIPPQRAKQLFDYAIVDTTSEKEGRNGVGLLLTKVLLGKYGASISLSKNSNRAGVQFTIKLKRAT